MFVESLKDANEDLAVLQDTSQSTVNALQHLAALSIVMVDVPPKIMSPGRFQDP